MTQPDAPETESPAAETTEMETPEMEAPAIETETTGGGMTPNGPVLIFGTWTFTATQIGGDDTLAGTLTLAEGQNASRLVLTDGFNASLQISELDVTNANFVLAATVQTEDGPLPFSLAGSLTGDEMSAEANVEGMGAYALFGTRRTP